MAGLEGLEPPSSGFGDRRSNQLELQACIEIRVFRAACAKHLLRLRALLRLAMQGVGLAKLAVFPKFQFLRVLFLVLGRRIISLLALVAGKYDYLSHLSALPPGPSKTLLSGGISPSYSTISETTPAPTVRPPSRMANRSSFSIAIGVINSTSMVTLSPGITISTPSGRISAPVTSVVRK